MVGADHVRERPKMTRLLRFLSLGLLITGGPSSPTIHGTVVFKGRIEHIHASDPHTLMIHQSRQFIVVSAQETLAGSEVHGRVLLGVIFDSLGSGVRKREEPFTEELDPHVWREGMEVIVRAVPSDPFYHTTACFPMMVSPLPEDARKSVDWPERVRWEDEDLQRFRPIPVYCASVGELYPICSAAAAPAP